MKSFVSWSTATCLTAAAVSVAWANLNAMQDPVGDAGGSDDEVATVLGNDAPFQDDQQPAATASRPAVTPGRGAATPGQSPPLGRYDNRAQGRGGPALGGPANRPGDGPGQPFPGLNNHFTAEQQVLMHGTASGFGQTINGQPNSSTFSPQGGMQSPYVVSGPQHEELNSALATWRDAGDDATARQSAKEKASELLATIYDELLNGQEQEIDALEKRVVELREQLGRRREAKSRMVELKLEMLLSQTDGLGWPSPETRSPLTTYRNPTREPGLGPNWAPAGASGYPGALPPASGR